MDNSMKKITPAYNNIKCLSEDLDATQLSSRKQQNSAVVTQLWTQYVEPIISPYVPNWIQSSIHHCFSPSKKQPPTDTELAALDLYARAMYASNRLLEANQSCPHVEEITEKEARIFYRKFSIHLQLMEEIRAENREFWSKLMIDDKVDLHGPNSDVFKKLSEWLFLSRRLERVTMRKKADIFRRFPHTLSF